MPRAAFASGVARLPPGGLGYHAVEVRAIADAVASMRHSLAENTFSLFGSAEWPFGGHQQRLRCALDGTSPEFGQEFLGDPVRDFFEPAWVVCLNRSA